MSTDNELEPIPEAPSAAVASADAPASAHRTPEFASESADSAIPPTRKGRMPRSTRILAMTAGGVVAVAAVFGGGVAFGTSLTTGGANTAQQGQFTGTPPSGFGGPGGTTGTIPTGAPSTAPTTG